MQYSDFGRVFPALDNSRTLGVVVEIGHDEFHIMPPLTKLLTQEYEPSRQESVQGCMEIRDKYNLHALQFHVVALVVVLQVVHIGCSDKLSPADAFLGRGSAARDDDLEGAHHTV